jgi:hypothetical protein
MELEYTKEWFERSAAMEGDAEVGAGVPPTPADLRVPARETDEEQLMTLWRNGKEAWAGIGSPTEWVEDLRNG